MFAENSNDQDGDGDSVFCLLLFVTSSTIRRLEK